MSVRLNYSGVWKLYKFLHFIAYLTIRLHQRLNATRFFANSVTTGLIRSLLLQTWNTPKNSPRSQSISFFLAVHHVIFVIHFCFVQSPFPPPARVSAPRKCLLPRGKRRSRRRRGRVNNGNYGGAPDQLGARGGGGDGCVQKENHRRRPHVRPSLPLHVLGR